MFMLRELMAGTYLWHRYLLDSYVIRSNREAGLGRADCIIRPVVGQRNADTNRAAIAIEFKHVKPAKGKKLTKASITEEAGAALKQISNKGYVKELTAEG